MPFVVNPKHSLKVLKGVSERIDLYLSKQTLNLTRSQVQRLVEEGSVRVNQKQVKTSYKLREGDEIEIEIPAPTSVASKPENIPLEILYQDKDLALVNKAAGLVVHASAGHTEGTLVNALLYHLKDLSGIGGELRPGIVHRLDKDTSGIMLIAKNNPTHAQLVRMFQERQIQKTYLALAYGIFKKDSGVIENKLGRSKGDRKKISSKTAHGKEAKTSYQVLERFSCFSLLEVKPYTGRTHQIRVHLAEAGHPIVGDPVYGSKQWTSKLNATLQALVKKTNRQMLHAYQLELQHPIIEKKIKQKAELPADFKEILNLSRKQNPKN